MLGIAPRRAARAVLRRRRQFRHAQPVYVEFGLVLWASKKLGRPVKYTATRSEAFLTDYQGRDLVTQRRAGVAQGRPHSSAMRADNISNVGAHCVSLSPLEQGLGPDHRLLRHSGGDAARARGVHQHDAHPRLSQLGPARGHLRDRAADRQSPRTNSASTASKLRRKNFVPAEGDALHQRGRHALRQRHLRSEHGPARCEIADWDGLQASASAKPKKRGKLLGLGLANYVESSIGSPRERAEITVKPEGRVDVVIGTQPSGQGHETSFAQVVADLLGVPVETVDIILGDTDIVSVGGGSHSGRSMRHAGTVIAQGRRRSDRRAASGSRRIALETDAGAGRRSRTGRFSAPRHQPHLRLLRTGAEAAQRTCRRSSPTASPSAPTTRCTSRCFRTAARSARSRSIPTPATSTSRATPRSTTSAAASIR